ncbi:MAG: CocE/NonD family hydrolase [Holophaga sp.]|nr:CocE/NonD family hydrolase [Holophaga sp.]
MKAWDRLKLGGRAAAAVLAGAVLCAQGAPYILEHYAKQETMVPMRDGTRLFTSIYAPRDRTRRYPFLLERTPYGVAPYGPDRVRDDLGPSPAFGMEGFIFVYQDVRGRMMSEGAAQEMAPILAHTGRPAQVDESTDTYDTVEWLLRHVPNHNGRAGQWGVSYPGFYAAAGLVDAHPAMKAVSPQGPIMDWFMGDDFHRNGALWLPHLFNYMATFGRPRARPGSEPPPFQHGTRDGYAFFLDLGPLANADRRYFKGAIPFWNQVMAHGSYDAFWQARNLRPHLRGVRPAVLAVGGWHDAENLFGALQLFQTLARQSPATDLRLVMGPWEHGGWADGSRPSAYFRARIELPFFLRHLKDGPDPGLARATMFETGADHWRLLDSWPPRNLSPVNLYFETRARLGFQKPDGGFDAYPSDPARPVPYYNGITIGMAKDYMTADQRFAGRRPDVLSYRSEPLKADLTLAGPVQADLWVSTSGTDSDWVVKLIDGFPEDLQGADAGLAGNQQLVRGEVMRGKFRNSFERPEPFVPGRPTEVRFSLNDVFHTFRKGHRLMVQVQSSWFPLMDRNPQVFLDIYQAREADFQAAEERLYHSPRLPSHLVLPVLP